MRDRLRLTAWRNRESRTILLCINHVKEQDHYEENIVNHA